MVVFEKADIELNEITSKSNMFRWSPLWGELGAEQ